jgi:elongation factor P
MGVLYKDSIWVVFDFEKVSKGNWRSYMQITLKNAKTGQIIKDRFRVDEQLEPAVFDRKPMEYLYTEGDHFVLMDPASYEQVELPKGLLGEDEVYLTPNIQLQVAFVEGKPISVELPFTVELKIVETPPVMKGATATNQNKDALCEGGARVKVPAFIEIGEVIRVDTRTGEYLSRA